MANKKFSEFELKTTTSNVSHVVGYDGVENVRITPANFLDTTGGPYLPLAGGIMVGNTTHNDNVKSIYGDGGDLEIYHSGAASYIKDIGTGNLDIQADSLSLLNAAGSEYYARFYTNGAAYLYNNGVAKFYTTGTGVEVVGDGTFTGDVNLVTGSKLYFDNGNTYISEDITDRLRFFVGGSEFMRFTEDTADNIDFYHNATFVGSVQSTDFRSAGVFYLTGDDWRFRNLSGAEKMRLDASGNLGIGTSTPFSGAKLDVFGDVVLLEKNWAFRGNNANADLCIEELIGTGFSDTNVKVTIKSGGNVGVGTTSPRAVGGGYTGLEISSPTSGSSLWLSGFTDSTKGYLSMDTSGLNLTAITNHPLKFGTNNAERMRLDASGNLGLGSSSAGAKLEIHTTQISNQFDRDCFLRLHPTSAINSGGFTNMFFGTSDANNYGVAIGGVRTGTDGVPSFAIRMLNDSTVGVEVFKIANSGLVNIINSLDYSLKFNNQSAYNSGINNGIAFNGVYTSGGSVTDMASIRGGKDNTVDTHYGGKLSFYTRQNGGVDTKRMEIDSVGNVGIGILPVSGARLSLGTGLVANEILSFAAASGGNAEIRNTSSTGSFTFTNNNGASEKMRLTSAGDLLVGTTAKETQGVTIYGTGANGLYIKTTGTCAYLITNSGGGGTDTSGVFNTFYNDNVVAGSITLANATTVSYNTSSDYRLKEDLQDFKGLDLVSKISVYDYKWKSSNDRSYGVMAHQLQKVLPDAVTGEKDAEEMQGVDYSKIVPLLVKSIQELSAKLEALECQCKKK
jgi:hypothetical protein